MPERLQGRVNSAYRLTSWGASSLGAAASGLVAASLGLRAVYAGAAVLVALLAVILMVAAGRSCLRRRPPSRPS